MYTSGFLREHSSLLLWIMRLTDVLVLLVACSVAYFIVFDSLQFKPHYKIAILFSVMLQLIVFNAYALYRTWRGVDYAQEFTAVIAAWTTIFGLLVFLSVITKTSASFSRTWLVIWFSGGGVAILVVRYSLRNALQRLRARGFNLRHIAIIGSGAVGEHVQQSILNAPESGFSIKAYFSDSSAASNPINSHLNDTIDEAVDFVYRNKLDQVWIAMPLSQADRINELMNDLSDATVDLRLVPDIYGFRLINHSVSTVAGMPVVNLSVTPMDGLNRWLKAIEDKALSFLILILISPLFLLIVIAVKVSSPGPVFYRQERLSWNGEKFTMFKFRTMPKDTEVDTGAVWATAEENRATRIGKFLRKTSLDELPQFWNVIKGDMSIVGPRPERPVFVEQFKDEIPSYMRKHMVKAGITGWAQVNGWRGDTDLEKRIEHDLYYIDNWSIWLDFRIMLLTLFRGFVHKNAY